MGNSSTLGLLFEINADPTQAQAALGQFQSQTQAATGAAAAASEDFGRRSVQSVGNSTHAARLMTEVMGIQLPRAITSSIAHMETFQAISSVAFSAAIIIYFIENLDRMRTKIAEGALALGGYSKEMQKMFEEAIKANEKMLSGFKTSELGKILVNETNLRISALEQEKAHWDSLTEGIGKIDVIAQKNLREVNSQLAILYTRREAQEEALTEVADKENKARTQGAKEAAIEQRRLSNEQYADQKRAAEEFYKALKEFEQQAAKDAKALTTEQAKLDEEMRKNSIAVMPAWISAIGTASAAENRLTDAQRSALPPMELVNSSLVRQWQNTRALVDEWNDRELPARRQIEIQIQRQANAAKLEIDAVRQEYETGKITLAQRRVQALLQEELAQERATIQAGVSLLQTIGFRRAAAIVEAVWETAQGFAALGRQQYWEAAQHFMSAAEYGIVAGRASTTATVVATGAGAGATTAAASAAASSGPAAQQQPTVQIIIQGPIYGGPAGLDELARKLSEAVRERDVNLTAYTVVRQPARRA